jgi:hypothetical protein
MSQHDFDIANQTSSNARADINNALKALASTSSGTTAPSTTYANMLWYDTSANILKMRAEADDAWINIGYLDQSADAFKILDDTQVVTTAGSQTGLLGGQTTGTWQTGTGTTESLVSPAQVKAAIDANASQTPVKAWVNFNGTNASIRASTGISSVTRNAAGDYSINLTGGLMPDANYASFAFASEIGSPLMTNTSLVSQTASVCRIRCKTEYVGSGADPAIVNVSFMR